MVDSESGFNARLLLALAVGKHMNMLITDPTLKPSERLLVVLEQSFSKDGYELTKSNKTFSRKFEYGIERIHVDLYTTIALVDASLGFSKTFLLIEKIHSLIFGTGKKYKNEKTIFSDLTNWYMNNKIQNVERQHHLFNAGSEDFENLYTDSSINEAANFLYKKYKETIEPIFGSIQTIQDLDYLLNREPQAYCNLMSWHYKRTQLGYIANWITNRIDKNELNSKFIGNVSYELEEAQSDFAKIDNFS